MKIHEKDPANSLLSVSPPSPTKRRRPSVKRRQGPEEETGEEPPSKRVVEDTAVEESAAALRGGEEELLPCPICFRTCSSRLELDAHMDTHPDTALRYTHTHTHTLNGWLENKIISHQMSERNGEREFNKSQRRRGFGTRSARLRFHDDTPIPQKRRVQSLSCVHGVVTSQLFFQR
ncbi:ras-responsive element-binding protein 1-like [Plectropomus leopardus]|uniref:ras-responsive element-binding protein 1-like n=1 Tax=Plectropomus leopardus TaxID=160734 RepID=UPI001C4C98CA|nr:ras-responsive element-binding protein 1-like [Plectropomus leopardus]